PRGPRRTVALPPPCHPADSQCLRGQASSANRHGSPENDPRAGRNRRGTSRGQGRHTPAAVQQHRNDARRRLIPCAGPGRPVMFASLLGIALAVAPAVATPPPPPPVAPPPAIEEVFAI